MEQDTDSEAGPDPAGGDSAPDSRAQALARSVSDSALLALGAAAGVGFGLLSLRLLLTGLTEEEYGRYCLFQIGAGLLVVLLAWPAHAVLRLGAEEVEGRGRVGRTAGSVLALVLASAAVLSAIVALIPDEWRTRALGWIGDAPLGVLAAFAGLTAAAQVSAALLQPAGRVGLRTAIPAASRAIYALLLGGALLAGQLTLGWALLLCAASALPAALLPLLAVGRRLGRPAIDPALVRRAAAFAWPLLLRNLGVAAVLYVDVLAIRAYFGAEQGTVLAGRYDVAYRIAEQVVVFGFVLEFLAGPPLAAAAARGDPATLARFYRLAVPPLAWVWGLGAALLVVLAEPLLGLLGAHEPAASGQVLAVLAVAVALRGVANLETPVLDAHLLSRGPAVIFFLGFAVNLGADVALLHAGWGILGPAVGTLLGYGLQSALRAAYLGRRLRVPAGWPYAAAAPAALLLALELLLDLPTWLGLAGWALVAGAVLVGRGRLGLVSSEGRTVLALMRMPSWLRRGLEALHPPENPARSGADQRMEGHP